MDDVVTAEEFELSFDLTPNSAKPERTSILRLSRSSGMWRYMPAFFFLPGSTRLECRMGRPDDHSLACATSEGLTIGTRAHVVVRLVGAILALYVDGESKCTITGYERSRYTPAAGVHFWIGGSVDGEPSADALVANVMYTYLGRPLHVSSVGNVDLEDLEGISEEHFTARTWIAADSDRFAVAPRPVPVLRLEGIASSGKGKDSKSKGKQLS